MEDIDNLVLVICTTYNHVNYIEKALNGFINQRTNFKFQVMVHDDASTDGTTEILKRYEKAYPDLFRMYYEEKNTYSQGKMNSIVDEIVNHQLHGKYVAYCEGDDFWIDKNKLQIQLDYLETHPDCSMTGHNVLVLDSRDNSLTPFEGLTKEQDITIEKMLLSNKLFQTSSFVIRRDAIKDNMDLLQDCTIGDWPLQLLASAHGYIHYFDRIMSVYRTFSQDSWTGTIRKRADVYINHCLSVARYLDRFDKYTDCKYSEIVKKQIEDYMRSAVNHGKRISDSELENICDELIKVNEKNIPLVNRIKELRCETKSSDEELKEYASKHNKLYIMGTGVYAGELVYQLEQLDIQFDGFVISNDQPLKVSFFNKDVKYLKDIKDEENVGILIGIKQSIRDSIEKSLADNEISDCYWPVL